MKKIVAIIALIIILGGIVLAFSGCSLNIETSNNSVSASVDGDTTEKVDNIIDWIKARISRLFNTDSNNNSAEEI